MKILKYLFFLLVLIASLLTFYVLLTDKSFSVNEKHTIKAPVEIVFEQVKDLKKWSDWVAYKKENYNQGSVSSDAQSEGSYLTWDRKNPSSNGKLTHTRIIHYSTILQEAEQNYSLGKIKYTIEWNFEEIEEQTNLSVTVQGYPDFWSKVYLLFKNSDFEKSAEQLPRQTLKNLAVSIEKLMEKHSISIDGVQELKPQSYVFLTEAAKNEPTAILTQRQQALVKLNKKLKDLKIEIKNTPIMVYNSLDADSEILIFSIGLPVPDSFDLAELDKELTVGRIKGQKYVKSSLLGNYKNITALSEKTKEYLFEHELEQDRDIYTFEKLKITSLDTSNPAEWHTELFIPVK